MIAYSEALNIILTQARAQIEQRSERVAIHECVGRVVAKSVSAPESLPAFDTSAMDGYAVRAEDTSLATADRPLRLPVLGVLGAGDSPATAAKQMSAWQIMTGAALPAPFDACVKQEDVRRVDDFIEITRPVSPGENRRRSGEDFKVDAAVLPVGHEIRSEDLLCLAALGLTHIDVYRRPRIAILATGKELVPADQKPHANQIRNSSTPYLQEALKRRGLIADHVVHVSDDSISFLEAVSNIKGVDLILTTGAVSVGKYDFVRDSLETLGASLFFHKVRVRPGKPILFCKLPDQRFVLSLPGNPVATATGFRFFVDPFLRAWSGRSEEKPLRLQVKDKTRGHPGFTNFLKSDHDGETVTILEDQRASITSTLLRSNAWVLLGDTDQSGHHERDADLIEAGSVVDVYPYL